jgi:hypothetical protein
MLGQDGLTVKVALTVRDQRQVALVEVTNETGNRVEVVPARMTLDLVQPESKSFPYLDPDTLAESVRRISGWEFVFDTMALMGAGRATQTSHTTGSITSQSASTVREVGSIGETRVETQGEAQVNMKTTTHDPVPQERVIENIKQNQERRASVASEIQYAALRENTVLPGEYVGGSVFSRRAAY